MLRSIDPAASPRIEAYAQIYYERRRARGISLEEAREIARKPLYFAAFTVAAGDADGTVGGAANTTGETVRAALHAIGLALDAKLVSSFFLMVMRHTARSEPWHQIGALLFADCAVVPDPNSEQLAEIARATRKMPAAAGCGTDVALLSFSTKGSASHAHIEKIREALRILKTRAPGLAADGELQADAALAARWPMQSTRFSCRRPRECADFSGPRLRKHCLQVGGATRRRTSHRPHPARLDRPSNDLSRGCSAEDIVNVVAITALQAIARQQKSIGTTDEH